MRRPNLRPNTALAATGQHAERCPHCHGRYVYELEVRCVDCDGPMCPLCVVHFRGVSELRCPRCPEEEEAP